MGFLSWTRLYIQPFLPWMDVGESWFNVEMDFGKMIFHVGA
jgi:hypothetical protein